MLTRWQRAVSGVIALGSAGTGFYAVLETNNEIGSATLLIIGVFFALVSLLGRVPRIRMGGNELDPAPWVELGGQVERNTLRPPQAGSTESAPPPAARPHPKPESTMDKLRGAMTDMERMHFEVDPTGFRGREAVRNAAERLAAVSGEQPYPPF